MPDPSGPELRALILSASFGSGHHQANDALDRALRAAGVDLRARHADFIAYLNAFERAVTVGTYDAWLRYAPGMYKAFYEWTDQETEPRALTGTFGWLGLRGMLRDMRDVRPEVVVSSFPTPVALAHTARQRLRADFLNALVVTDYRVHHHWARPEAELLMVANEEARGQMVDRWRLPEANVAVTGIPIAPAYRTLIGADRTALREKHGLKVDEPLILVSGGGTGTYRALNRVLNELANLGRRVQVLVLAGARGRGVTRVGGATVHALGFTTAFPELLAASDLVVGKAGGLTVAEATTLGVPLVIFEPIPGQEEHNADYLVRHGAGLWAHALAEVRPAVLRALDAGEHARLSANARALSVPDAADRVAAALLRKLGRA
ncbi:UDP-N-acetylglucosamine--LPS N-acetylglucosamine transferase [Deinococcus metallilatus]|uniref:Processive 1,2-diacylglycerol beta-glucosyltransferase n=1 Tax=Deinococcus metallilatus TaxID=1211322 RepID=A0AAJ5F3H1_9DEIO|nr:glycosyltransferase [Deinococcus metallilatus]MBB5294186.1 processive 1,2-diacylglycerol beta-glucosyltransferase [Deinococcus metallilatus]QBY08965.1 UDP-N-acetylglucosamine--LPS N-acetylglucosamine transferase [Deinococcus metallilatus]RXJ10109.1 UDP-N-acetylglucosamine--LPS N-acetylglucosamine transferase [Deinococcus metallilatus]TLK27954.1 UDP-N-acetylglucosamine--LPS N-acetylglucosamine transferase [Deinococcus metallilatus]GMA16477.1 cell wall synthesis protein [Deinococcus metallila